MRYARRPSERICVRMKSRVFAGSGSKFHAGIASRCADAFFHSPSSRSCAADMTKSRVFSGGPLNTCRSKWSSSRRKVRETAAERRFGSKALCARLGSSSSSAHKRCTASTSSRLMCMWYGTSLRRSSRSCSGLRSAKRDEETACASSSFRRGPAAAISMSDACASGTSSLTKAQMPKRTSARLYKICVEMSDWCTVSPRCDMSSMSRAAWYLPCSARWYT
mmetsp:Transcript_6175/g.14242  ORF Transcript_6175/g.14242 Transcript_6175/m.14242 type:complete len:221 (-) Transcript_6175:347-1009(-)